MMIKQSGLDTPAHNEPGRPPRKRHWWRWVLTAVVALVALIVAPGFLGSLADHGVAEFFLVLRQR